jgi:hypothetical protein
MMMMWAAAHLALTRALLPSPSLCPFLLTAFSLACTCFLSCCLYHPASVTSSLSYTMSSYLAQLRGSCCCLVCTRARTGIHDKPYDNIITSRRQYHHISHAQKDRPVPFQCPSLFLPPLDGGSAVECTTTLLYHLTHTKWPSRKYPGDASWLCP